MVFPDARRGFRYLLGTAVWGAGWAMTEQDSITVPFGYPGRDHAAGEFAALLATLRGVESEAVVAALSQTRTLYSGETSCVRHGFGSYTDHGRDQRNASAHEQWWRSAPAVQDLSTVAGGECD